MSSFRQKANVELILPGDPKFYRTLAMAKPPDYQQVAAKQGTYALIARSGGCGMLEAVTSDELEEYLDGGEYDERLSEIEDDELAESDGNWADEDVGLYLPYTVELLPS